VQNQLTKKNQQMETGKRFLMAGGGTGGHIFPAVAIAQALKRLQPASQIRFVGARGKMEMEKVPQAGFEIDGLSIAGFDRSSLIKNLWLPFKLMRSFGQVASIFRRFKPDAVIGVGGYSSFPVLRYAQWKGIPTFIHEANSFAGKSNILLGKKATAVFAGAPGLEKFFPKEKMLFTGNPVRKRLLNELPDSASAKRFFGMNPNKPVLLVVGGSLGARSINQSIAKHVDEILNQGWQLVWQTGLTFEAEAKRISEQHKDVSVHAFIQEMEQAYAAADLVISRSGAMSVAELSIVCKPVIFVPFPFAAEDHQTANAKTLVQRDAAAMIPDAELSTALMPTLLKLMQDGTKRGTFRNNIAAFAIKDADEQVAREILTRINA
jgi:UDP-N-acetylglucosamine--N-acetylmuramyl-(pentapeptide) pyrophosphoryl-undecaprenol N-acetylglucosamine transferase